MLFQIDTFFLFLNGMILLMVFALLGHYVYMLRRVCMHYVVVEASASAMNKAVVLNRLYERFVEKARKGETLNSKE